MSVVQQPADLAKLSGPIVFIVAMFVTALAYFPGLTGTLHFDDAPNLDGLARVADAASALRYVTQGDAGPTGRPLALASFAAQAYAWPSSPSVFLSTNVFLHLLNGALVVWLLLCICKHRDEDDAKAAWTAAMAGAIWMLSPILASSSLLIVQRMTTLSATFLLLGFIGYLYARRLLERRPAAGLVSMSAAVTLGTTAAMLAKENGALLPVLVLVTEFTLLRRPSAMVSNWWRAWLFAFLALPAALLAVYLVTRLPYSESVVLARGFSGAERLLTEASVLWQYLFRAAFPVSSAFGPFHDDYPVTTSWVDPWALTSVVAWFATIAGAVLLRRRLPWSSFAAGWYLIAHSLESTTIQLELYFEHRNYVPLIGPAFALVATLRTPRLPQPIMRAGLIAYAALLAVVLGSTTSLWGKPALAAEIWAIEHPYSKRATQYLSQRLEGAGDYGTSRRMLELYRQHDPESVGVAMQILALSCVIQPTGGHEQLLSGIRTQLRTARFEHGVFETLVRLDQLADDERCAALTPSVVYELASLVERNEAFRASPLVHHNLNVLMFQYASAERNLERSMSHLEAALAARYSPATLRLAVATLLSAGLPQLAQELLDDAERHTPMHPIRALVWRREFAAIQKAILAGAEQARVQP